MDKEGRNARNGAGVEVVATSREEAIEKAAAGWHIDNLAAIPRVDAYPLRPFKETETSRVMLGNRPSNPDGNYVIVNWNDRTKPVYRFMAADDNDALLVLRQWMTANPENPYVFKSDPDQSLGQPDEPQSTPQQTQPRFGLWDFSEGGFIDNRGAVGQGGQLIGGDSFDTAREAARRNGLVSRIDAGEVEIRRIPQQQPTQQGQGNWGIYITTLNRFARMPNTDAADNVLRRFPSRESAEQYLATTSGENPRMRTDIEVREIEPAGSSRNELSQTDIENRLGWGGQAADANYEVVDRQTMRPVFKFIANTPDEANRKYGQFLDVMMLPHNTENYGYREIVVPGDTIDLQRQRAAAANRTDGSNINYSFRDLFGTNATADQQQGGIVDVAPDVAQNFPSRGVELRGWKIVGPDGNTLHEFGGVGNVQADANTYALGWLRRNPEHMQTGVEVVPNWVEA